MARAEILKKNCWCFGWNYDTKRTFWNQLTFNQIYILQVNNFQRVNFVEHHVEKNWKIILHSSPSISVQILWIKGEKRDFIKLLNLSKIICIKLIFLHLFWLIFSSFSSFSYSWTQCAKFKDLIWKCLLFGHQHT